MLACIPFDLLDHTQLVMTSDNSDLKNRRLNLSWPLNLVSNFMNRPKTSGIKLRLRGHPRMQNRTEDKKVKPADRQIDMHTDMYILIYTQPLRYYKMFLQKKHLKTYKRQSSNEVRRTVSITFDIEQTIQAPSNSWQLQLLYEPGSYWR